MFKNGITKENLPEFKGNIVDIFEDYLDDEDIFLANEERDEAIYDGEEDIAIIYGDHYDMIADTVEQCVDNQESIADASDHIMQSFFDVLRNGEVVYVLPDEDVERLRRSVIDTFIRCNYKVEMVNNKEE